MGATALLNELGERRLQEDRCLIKRFNSGDLDGCLIGVFDGHNGGKTAEYCMARFAKYFEPTSALDVPDAMRRAIAKLAVETKGFEAGTTLSVVCILESHDSATAAVIGDSPILMRNIAGGEWHSPNHNVGVNQREREAAIKRGAKYVVHEGGTGYIHRDVDGFGLQLGRALGDKSLRTILSDIPDMYTMRRPTFVMVMTDGMVDLTEDDQSAIDEVADIAEKAGHPSIAVLRMLSWREKRGRMRDNLSAVLWQHTTSRV